LFFFFFQAEDGIRDLIVTGVQTCALPISADFDRRHRLNPKGSCAIPAKFRRCLRSKSAGPTSGCKSKLSAGNKNVPGPLLDTSRSEERRVGKEWKCGRAAGRDKKKEDMRK